MIEIIIGTACGVVVILAMIITRNVCKNKLDFSKIKIDEAENSIDSLLVKKIELLNQTIPIIEKELKLEGFMDGLNALGEVQSRFELNNVLSKCYDQLFATMKEHDKLYKSEKLIAIVRKLNDNEEDVNGSIKYYNSSVSFYNNLISSFPTGIVAFFHGHKKKDLFTEEEREMYDLLND